MLLADVDGVQPKAGPLLLLVAPLLWAVEMR